MSNKRRGTAGWDQKLKGRSSPRCLHVNEKLVEHSKQKRTLQVSFLHHNRLRYLHINTRITNLWRVEWLSPLCRAAYPSLLCPACVCRRFVLSCRSSPRPGSTAPAEKLIWRSLLFCSLSGCPEMKERNEVWKSLLLSNGRYHWLRINFFLKWCKLM